LDHGLRVAEHRVGSPSSAVRKGYEPIHLQSSDAGDYICLTATRKRQTIWRSAKQPALLQILWPKRIGQELIECVLPNVTSIVSQQHAQVRGKLAHHLAARTARAAPIASGDGNGDKLSLPLRHSFDNRSALGTNRHGVRGIFDVTTGEYLARRGQQSCAHVIMRVRRIGIPSGLLR
jgi:hypothetical protein